MIRIKNYKYYFNMHFDESLFEDFQNNTKAKIKQCSYEARNIQMGWFLTNSETCNESQTTDILRHKADYFYAQCDYGKALEYYEKLLQAISATNKMLCHEVKESVIRCLRKMNKNLEVLKIRDEMSEANKMDSLWLLLFNIHKDENNTKGAIFALQRCLEHHEEVADYWIKLASSYNRLSTCFELDDLFMVGSTWYLNDKDLSLDWHGMQQHDHKDTRLAIPTDTTKSTTDTTTKSTTDTTTKPTTDTTTKTTTDTTMKTTTDTTMKSTTDTTMKSTTDTTKSTTDTTKSTTDTTMKTTTDTTMKSTTDTTKSTTDTTKSTTDTTTKSTTDTTKSTTDTTTKTTTDTTMKSTTDTTYNNSLYNKEVTGAMEEKHMLQPDCNTSVALEHYVQEHYYCFCTLCSLIIARFLLNKYSFHSSALQSKKENFVKVASMIKSIGCASVDIMKDTERLVNEKFAISSVSRCKPPHSNATDKSIGIYEQDEMIQRIKDFEKQWFPFL